MKKALENTQSAAAGLAKEAPYLDEEKLLTQIAKHVESFKKEIFLNLEEMEIRYKSILTIIDECRYRFHPEKHSRELSKKKYEKDTQKNEISWQKLLLGTRKSARRHEVYLLNIRNSGNSDNSTKDGRGSSFDPTSRDESLENLSDRELSALIHSKVDELSGSSLTELWAFLNALATKPEPSPQPDAKALIPTEPPDGQLYENRSDKTQSAPDFIEIVYEKFLNGIFTRADLRRIDPKAEMGLRNWERDHKQRADINLPTKKELNDRLLQTPWEQLTPHEQMARKRIQSVRANNERRRTQKVS